MNGRQLDVCGSVLAALYGADAERKIHGGAVLVMTIHGVNVLHTCLNAMRHGLKLGDVLLLYRFGRLIRRMP